MRSGAGPAADTAGGDTLREAWVKGRRDGAAASGRQASREDSTSSFSFVPGKEHVHCAGNARLLLGKKGTWGMAGTQRILHDPAGNTRHTQRRCGQN